MSIKARIILLSLFGNVVIGAIFFVLYEYQDKQKKPPLLSLAPPCTGKRGALS